MIAVALIGACGGAKSTEPPKPKPVEVAVDAAVASVTSIASDAAVADPSTSQIKITSVAPDKGDADGGTYTMIYGTGFLNSSPRAAKVYFGARQGEVVRFASDGELIVQAPGGKPGEVVDVLVVFDPGGQTKLVHAFTFIEKTTNGPTVDDLGTKPGKGVTVSDKQSFDESTLSADGVLSKIQAAYLSGIKRCYKDELKKDATARGKLRLGFTVKSNGATAAIKVNGFATGVEACTTSLIALWTFPIPKDKDGDATEASFSITLNMVPE